MQKIDIYIIMCIMYYYCHCIWHAYTNRFDELDLQPAETRSLSFKADSDKLRENIRSFGYVDPYGISGEAFAEPGMAASASLPRAFEDYEDEEHHVLYKTLDSVSQGSSTQPQQVSEVSDIHIYMYTPLYALPVLKAKQNWRDHGRHHRKI